MGKKSDDDDATPIAKKHQAGKLVEVYVESPELRKTHDIVRQHEFFKTSWMGINNNLKATLIRANSHTSKTLGKQNRLRYNSLER